MYFLYYFISYEIHENDIDRKYRIINVNNRHTDGVCELSQTRGVSHQPGVVAGGLLGTASGSVVECLSPPKRARPGAC